MKGSTLKTSLLEARLKDHAKMEEAARRMDAFRRKYGKPTKGFDSVTLLRKLRENR